MGKTEKEKKFSIKTSGCIEKPRGFLLPCDPCLWTIYLKIVWANLQYKADGTFQTALQKQATGITTSKAGEPLSFLIKPLDTVPHFEAFVSLAVVILVYWQCSTIIIWVVFFFFF